MEGKVAIVTGSATGVGAATAILLAKKGCNVVINYTRSKEEAISTSKLVEEQNVECIVVKANVAIDKECKAMVQAAIDKWGRIDYLVNNAGKTKFNPFQNLDGLSSEDFLDILDDFFEVTFEKTTLSFLTLTLMVSPLLNLSSKSSSESKSSMSF